jgi:hypothetical protein
MKSGEPPVPTVFTLLAVPLTGRFATGRATTSTRLLVTRATASVLPDLDAIGSSRECCESAGTSLGFSV